jgi:hypothetical protein
MRGQATDIGDTFVMFNVPDDDKVLDGAGDNTVAHVIIYDNNAKRASSLDAKTVLTLKATGTPLSAKKIVGVSALVVIGVLGILFVIIILMIVLMRGGGDKKRRGGAPPPAPPPGPGAPYGGAPYGGGAPPYGGGGGYNMQAQDQPPPTPMAAPPQQQAQPMFAPAAAPPLAAATMDPALMATAQPAVVQVRCPACQSTTMATPGQPSVCFSCGQPLPANITGGGGSGNAPAFPLTGGMPAQLQPPPNPYADGISAGLAPAANQPALGPGTVLQPVFVPPAAATASAATIRGALGQFTIRPGAEVRVGRDPAQCPIFLSEPRVSGVHATLKLELGQLWVRDETSNNGTYVAGSRVGPGAWTPVPAGAQLRFGPIEFLTQLEG